MTFNSFIYSYFKLLDWLYFLQGYKQNNNICTQEDSKESYAWDAIKMFKLYFKEMVANTMGWSKLCSLLEVCIKKMKYSNNIQVPTLYRYIYLLIIINLQDDTEQKFEQNEQSIIQHNSDSTTAVEKLQTLCVELSFETIYVHVNSILPQKGGYLIIRAVSREGGEAIQDSNIYIYI